MNATSPERRMAAISNAVATGRRMKDREGLTDYSPNSSDEEIDYENRFSFVRLAESAHYSCRL